MSQEAAEAQPIRVSPTSPQTTRRGAVAAALNSRYRWVLAALVLLVISTVLVLWADTRPGYDPYGWLVWGKLTVHWKLDTNGAPSWKPLPFLFTVPFAVVGHYALWLWMILSVAVSLSGLVVRVADRRASDRRAPGPAVGRLRRRCVRRPGAARHPRLHAFHLQLPNRTR